MLFVLFALAIGPWAVLATHTNDHGGCGTTQNDCTCYAGCSGYCSSSWGNNWCNYCSPGKRMSGDNCKWCTPGNSGWHCGVGSYRGGYLCPGGSSGTDTQRCYGCSYGSSWNVGINHYRSGSTCSGTGTSNTQSRKACKSTCATSGQYLGTACSGYTSSDRACYDCSYGSSWSVGTGYRQSGSKCTSTSTSNTQSRVACTYGNSAYNVGSGYYRSGTVCPGTSGTDTQTRAACSYGASWFVAVGYRRVGSACTGTGTSNTQSRTGCSYGAAWNVDQGYYRSGTQCTGYGTTNSQTRAACAYGGPLWDVGTGYYRTGVWCSGTTTSNTQTRAECTYGSAYDVGPGYHRGPQTCTGTGTSNVQTRVECTGGGTTWECELNHRREGTACTGRTDGDTQQCVPCLTSVPVGYYMATQCLGGTSFEDRRVVECTGGPDWDCGSNSRRVESGFVCDGLGSEDTQKCTACRSSCPADHYMGADCPGTNFDDRACIPCRTDCNEEQFAWGVGYGLDPEACDGRGSRNRACLSPIRTCWIEHHVDQAALTNTATAAQPITFTLEFDNIVHGVEVEDFTVAGLTLGVHYFSAAVSPMLADTDPGVKVYQFTLWDFAPSAADREVRVGYSNSMTVEDNYACTETNGKSVVILDMTAPVATSGVARESFSGASVVTFDVTFNEVVQLDASDPSLNPGEFICMQQRIGLTDFPCLFSMTSACFAQAQPCKTWVAAVNMPSSAEGEFQLIVPDNMVLDDAQNRNLQTSLGSMTFDNAPASVTVNQAASQADPASSSAVRFTAIFSKPVTGFDEQAVQIMVGVTAVEADSVSVTNADGGVGQTFTITVIPSDNQQGYLTVTVAAGYATDQYGNINTASTSTDNVVQYSNIGMSADLQLHTAQAAITNQLPIRFKVAFSNPVSLPLDVAKFSINVAATLSPLGGPDSSASQDTWFEIKIANLNTDTLVTVDLYGQQITDIYGQVNQQSVRAVVRFDPSAPRVTIDHPYTEATAVDPPVFWARWSEPVNFTGADVSFSRAGASAVVIQETVGSTLFKLEILGLTGSDGSVTISVASNTLYDVAGNGNALSAPTTIGSNVLVYDLVSRSPTLYQPLSRSVLGNPFQFEFLIPETPTSESVKLTLTYVEGDMDVQSPHELTVQVPPNVRSSIPIALDNIAQSGGLLVGYKKGLTDSPGQRGLQPGAVYTLVLSYQDELGNAPGEATAIELLYQPQVTALFSDNADPEVLANDQANLVTIKGIFSTSSLPNDPVVRFGHGPAGTSYDCVVQASNQTVITCIPDITVGVVSFKVTLQQYSVTIDAGTLRFPTPVITPSSLRETTDTRHPGGVSLENEQAVFSAGGDDYVFAGVGWGTDADLVRVFLSSDPQLECEVTQFEVDFLTVRTPRGFGSDLGFIVDAGGLQSIRSNFNYSYPTTPTVLGVSGCPGQMGDTTTDCPTEGKDIQGTSIIITVHGFNFDIGTQLSCTVATSDCPIVGTPNATDFTCELPEGTGLNNIIAVTVNSKVSFPQLLVSYAPPVITIVSPALGSGCQSEQAVLYYGQDLSVSTCEPRYYAPAEYAYADLNQLTLVGRNVSRPGDLIHGLDGTSECPFVATRCPREFDPRPQIIIQGNNFGARGADVVVGNQKCIRVEHSAIAPHRQLLCYLPTAKGINLPVAVDQSNGPSFFSRLTVSFDYCPLGKGESPDLDALECTECVPGKFRNVLDEYFCTDCGIGRYAIDPGSTSCSDGEPGYWVNGTSQAEQLACPAGKWSASAATTCTECVAGRISQNEFSAECALCPDGFHQDQPGKTECIACDFGRYSLQGNVHCETCRAGSIIVDNVCLPCDPGKFHVENNNSCAECPIGRWNPNPGSTLCGPCAAGQSQPAVGQESCVLCAPGTHQTMPGNDTCVACPVGRYTPINGAESCYDCEAGKANGAQNAITCPVCPDGYFSEAGWTDCQPCPRGTYSLSGAGKCTSCPGGTATNLTAQPACLACTAGKYALGPGEVTCTKCPLGQFSGGDNAVGCERCDRGRHAATGGQSSCVACEVGKKASEPGSSACTLCEIKYYAGSTGSWSCTECQMGSYGNVTGLSQCAKCTPGKYSAARASSCTSCRAGTYGASERLSTCTDCPMGAATNETGKVQCDLCEAGRYASEEGKRECLPCPVGRSTNVGEEACELCPGRTVTPWEDSPNCFICDSKSTPNTQKTDCMCKTNFFATKRVRDHAVEFSCQACPDGARCNYEGVSMDNMETLAGWWRSSNDTTMFYRCLVPRHCVGGRGQCAANRHGPLCFLCDKGYEESSFSSVCELCPTRGTSIATASLIFAAFLLGAFLVYFGLLRNMDHVLNEYSAYYGSDMWNTEKRKAGKMPQQQSTGSFRGSNSGSTGGSSEQRGSLNGSMSGGILDRDVNVEKLHKLQSDAPDSRRRPNFMYKSKILVSFFQLGVSGVFTSGVTWPSYYRAFMSTFTVLINFDFIPWQALGCATQLTFLIKALIVGSMPVACLLLILLWVFILWVQDKNDYDDTERYRIRRTRSNIKGLKMTLFTVFLLYPHVSSTVISVYNCITVEGTSYLVKDLSILCTSDLWIRHALITLPFILLYPIGIPLFYYLTLRSMHLSGQLNHPLTKAAFGFLYEAYTNTAWYFELIDMGFKLFVTAILVFLPGWLELPFAMVTIVLYLIYILLRSPYVRKGDDRMHLLMLNTLFVVAMMGFTISSYGSTVLPFLTDLLLSGLLIGMTCGIVLVGIVMSVSNARKILQNVKRKKALQRADSVVKDASLQNVALYADPDGEAFDISGMEVDN